MQSLRRRERVSRHVVEEGRQRLDSVSSEVGELGDELFSRLMTSSRRPVSSRTCDCPDQTEGEGQGERTLSAMVAVLMGRGSLARKLP